MPDLKSSKFPSGGWFKEKLGFGKKEEDSAELLGKDVERSSYNSKADQKKSNIAEKPQTKKFSLGGWLKGIFSRKEEPFIFSIYEYKENASGEWSFEEIATKEMSYPSGGNDRAKTNTLDGTINLYAKVRGIPLTAQSGAEAQSGGVLDARNDGVQKLFRTALEKGDYYVALKIFDSCATFISGGSDIKKPREVYEEDLAQLLTIKRSDGKTIKDWDGFNPGIVKAGKRPKDYSTVGNDELRMDFQEALREKTSKTAFKLIELCSKEMPASSFRFSERRLNPDDYRVKMLYKEALEHKNWAVLGEIIRFCANNKSVDMNTRDVYKKDLESILKVNNKEGKNIYDLTQNDQKVLTRIFQDAGIKPGERPPKIAQNKPVETNVSAPIQQAQSAEIKQPLESAAIKETVVNSKQPAINVKTTSDLEGAKGDTNVSALESKPAKPQEKNAPTWAKDAEKKNTNETEVSDVRTLAS